MIQLSPLSNMSFQQFHRRLLILSFPPNDHQRPWIHKQQRPVADRSTIRRRLLFLSPRRLSVGSTPEPGYHDDLILPSRYHRPNHANRLPQQPSEVRRNLLLRSRHLPERPTMHGLERQQYRRLHQAKHCPSDASHGRQPRRYPCFLHLPLVRRSAIHQRPLHLNCSPGHVRYHLRHHDGLLPRRKFKKR